MITFFQLFGFESFRNREHRLAWQISGPAHGPVAGPPGPDDSLREFRSYQRDGIKKSGMVEWLQKANEKFKEARNGQPGYQIERLKDLVKEALAQGDIDASEIRAMKHDIVDILEPNLTGDEIKQLLKKFPTDEEALLDLWEDAGLITKKDIRDFARAGRAAASAPAPSSSESHVQRPSVSSSKPPETQEKFENIEDLREELESVRLEGQRLTGEYASLRPKRGIGRNPGINRDPGTVAERSRIATERRANSQRYNELNEIYKRRKDNPSKGSSYGKYLIDKGAMTYRGRLSQDDMQAKAEKMDDEHKIQKLEEQLAKEKAKNGLRTLKEWDQHRGNTHVGNAWAKEEQWRKEWAAEGIHPESRGGLRPGPGEILARGAEAFKSGNSSYYDGTSEQKEAAWARGEGGYDPDAPPMTQEQFEALTREQKVREASRWLGRKSVEGSKESEGKNGSNQGKNEYLRKQDKLRQKYIPELTEFVVENLPKVKDDPNYERINKAFNRAMEHWKDDPDRAYGDLAIMRSQIEYMQKRGKFNQMKTMREKIAGGDIVSLYKKSIGSSGGRYFNPDEKVRITIPAELLPNSEGKDLTVVYEPFTVIGTEEDSQMQALMDAGIIIDKKEATAGTYPDGRPRVQGIDVHFTRQGRYILNGIPITIGEKGKEEKKEEFKGPVLGKYSCSFRKERPRSIYISDENNVVISFDVRSLKPNERVFDSTGSFAVTRLSAGQFSIECERKGPLIIEGFEDQSGHRMFAIKVNPGVEPSAPGSSPSPTQPERREEHIPFNEEMEKEFGLKISEYIDSDIRSFILTRKNNWQKAKNIGKSLNVSFDVDHRQGIDKLMSLLSIAESEYCEQIAEAVQDSSFNKGFTSAPRTAFDIEKDRSPMMIVSDILKNDSNFSQETDKAKRIARIQTEWSKLRERQWNSFGKSEELNDDGKSKPIDLLVIAEANDTTTELWALRANDLIPQALRANGTMGEHLARVNVPVKSPSFDFIAQYQDKVKKSDHHLLIYYVTHGNASGLKNSLGIIDALTTKIDTKKCSASVLFASCYGGAQMRNAVRERGTKSLNGVPIFTTINSTVEPLVQEQDMLFRMREGYEKPAGATHQNADMDKNGIVTLSELRVWLDETTLYHDAVSYGADGNRYVGSQDPSTTEGIS